MADQIILPEGADVPPMEKTAVIKCHNIVGGYRRSQGDPILQIRIECHVNELDANLRELSTEDLVTIYIIGRDEALFRR